MIDGCVVDERSVEEEHHCFIFSSKACCGIQPRTNRKGKRTRNKTKRKVRRKREKSDRSVNNPLLAANKQAR